MTWRSSSVGELGGRRATQRVLSMSDSDNQNSDCPVPPDLVMPFSSTAALLTCVVCVRASQNGCRVGSMRWVVMAARTEVTCTSFRPSWPRNHRLGRQIRGIPSSVFPVQHSVLRFSAHARRNTISSRTYRVFLSHSFLLVYHFDIDISPRRRFQRKRFAIGVSSAPCLQCSDAISMEPRPRI